MNCVSVEEALLCAEENFPDALEKLAELLNVEVRRAVFEGDGWCLRRGMHAIIRINSDMPSLRQKFTLAHELSHLLLDIPSIIGGEIGETRNSGSNEEKRVNELAGRLLLPLKIVRRFNRELPISLKTIKSLAKTAKVSEPFAMHRLTELSVELGLLGAAVIYYENGIYKRQFRQGQIASINAKTAQQLLADCSKAENKTVVLSDIAPDINSVAILLSNPRLRLQTIFMQKMRRNDSQNLSIQQLENELLQNKESFRNSLQGCFGVIKPKILDLSLDEAVALFNAKYLENSARWDEDFRQRLMCVQGQIYIRARLRIWSKDDNP